jgi:hypothetical protein
MPGAGRHTKAEALTLSHIETDFRDAQAIDFAGGIFRPVSYPLLDGKPGRAGRGHYRMGDTPTWSTSCRASALLLPAARRRIRFEAVARDHGLVLDRILRNDCVLSAGTRCTRGSCLLLRTEGNKQRVKKSEEYLDSVADYERDREWRQIPPLRKRVEKTNDRSGDRRNNNPRRISVRRMIRARPHPVGVIAKVECEGPKKSEQNRQDISREAAIAEHSVGSHVLCKVPYQLVCSDLAQCRRAEVGAHGAWQLQRFLRVPRYLRHIRLCGVRRIKRVMLRMINKKVYLDCTGKDIAPGCRELLKLDGHIVIGE